jgi:hypothetical protein
MPTPPKPFSVLTTEKKSHRTKAELKARKDGEEALSTGVALKARSEVKNNPIAYKEFKRVSGLLATIGKNDAIYETIINRYCLLLAECADFEITKERLQQDISDIRDMYKAKEIDPLDYLQKKEKLESLYMAADKKIMEKRKMMFDIEKENVMTIAAALRSIPKKQEKSSSKLLEALKDG